jgi:hypothetical protein
MVASESEIFSDSDSGPSKSFGFFRIRIHNTGIWPKAIGCILMQNFILLPVPDLQLAGLSFATCHIRLCATVVQVEAERK